MSELDKARMILNKNDDTSEEPKIEMGLDEYISSTIAGNLCSTIGIFYSFGTVSITLKYQGNIKLLKYNQYSEKDYLDFCERLLKIDLKEKYNCSRSLLIEGVKTRVYALMPPLCSHPNITISTTKTPPAQLDKMTISDEVWYEIVHSNFIIIGGSGSGKTFLLNYLLSRYIRKDERITLVGEFDEGVEPNEFTSTILVPPPKPNEENLLKFVTQQLNLMRLDAFYVMEVKGAEAWPMVVNMASGTRGGCTLHGENATQALNRLRALCQESCDNDEAIDDFIAKSIKYVIVMKDTALQQIYKLTGMHHKNSFGLEEVNS